MVLLKYLYCDEIDLEADTVLAVLYAAKKYIVPHLARSCVRFLETSLSAKNACVLLSQSRLFEVGRIQYSIGRSREWTLASGKWRVGSGIDQWQVVSGSDQWPVLITLPTDRILPLATPTGH